MSTKIHNGYKLNIKFDELIPFCIKTRSELEIIKKQLYMKTVTTRLTNRKDRNLLLNKDTNIFKESMKEIKEDADEMAKGIISSWGLDFQAEAVFYLDGEDVYATFHCDCTEIINYWQSLPIVLDYHYQNQTDKPSNISSQNWEKRSQIWKKLLKGISFAENGLSYSFTGLKNTYF